METSSSSSSSNSNDGPSIIARSEAKLKMNETPGGFVKKNAEVHVGGRQERSGGGLRRVRKPEKSRRMRSKRSVHVMKIVRDEEEEEEEDEEEEEEGGDEKEEVEKKIGALKRIVPGGESLAVDKLFEETAGYILSLQFQVKALRVLASFVEGAEKEKRKLGG